MKNNFRELFKHPEALTFFVTKSTRQIFFIKNGKIQKFGLLTIDDAKMLRMHLEKEKDFLNTLDQLGVHDPIAQLKVWIELCFPTIYSHPDFVGSKRITTTKKYNSADIHFCCSN